MATVLFYPTIPDCDVYSPWSVPTFTELYVVVSEIDIIIFIKTYSTTREMLGWMIYETSRFQL
ncbi:hypothetical protein V1478_003514 [Vespula squamosa]|uniref:Uncharacterized protein n=1 Tax=Vespula squamosa TaxID=30214 RepID=A0ABD2BM18_VESSQ